jgi:hypothetical protein
MIDLQRSVPAMARLWLGATQLVCPSRC